MAHKETLNREKSVKAGFIACAIYPPTGDIYAVKH